MLGIAAHNITDGMTTGLVMTSGILENINTNSWTAGTVLYPDSSVAGGLTSTQPTAPSIKVPVAIVLTQNSSTGKILVNITPSSVLGGTDSNVKFTSLIDNDVVSYDAALGVWINKQPTGGGGGASITVSDTPPGSPSAGQMWFNSANGKMYLYYDSYWVEVGSSSQSGAVSTDVALSNSWWLGV
jgi:hypothetical protein